MFQPSCTPTQECVTLKRLCQNMPLTGMPAGRSPPSLHPVRPVLSRPQKQPHSEGGAKSACKKPGTQAAGRYGGKAKAGRHGQCMCWWGGMGESMLLFVVAAQRQHSTIPPQFSSYAPSLLLVGRNTQCFPVPVPFLPAHNKAYIYT